jgi:ABC transport system ATP-binding/permease protein
MHYASIENVSKSFGIRSLFQNISFHIEEGDKIAFIARNGSGKSTLLKIIAGTESPDNGTVWIHKDIKVVMLEQEHHFEESKSIWDNVLRLDNEVIRAVKNYEQLIEAGGDDQDKMFHLVSEMDKLGAWNFESELKQILGKLQINNLQEPVKNLSGGQKKRVALAQSIIEAQLHEDRCLLLLDEPTNHLDIDMIEWLEDYLAAHKVTLLLITHDRYFLDSVCNEILELEDGKLYTYKGNYDYFLEQKSLRQEVQLSELQKDKNIFRKELEWMRKQPKARTTKSKSRQDAFKEVEQRVARKEIDQGVNLQVKMTRLGGKILEMKKVYKKYGEKVILKGFDYTFKKGERIGIVGKNGIGKSTFLKIALQQEEPDSGKINHGDTVVFGNFGQEGLQYKEDKRAIDYVKEFAEFFPLADGTKVSASEFMEKFGFSSLHQYTPLSKLSGGEKRRLHLLSILFRNPNFLILDEPTNDLDLQTLRTLEEFLLDFRGCVLIVSHDRYFMDRLVDHLFAFEGNGIITDFPGNYSLYRASREIKNKAQEIIEVEKSPAKTSVQEIVKPVKLSFKEKFEFETLEKELSALQEEKKMLEAQLNTNLPYDQIQKAAERISKVISLLDEKEMRWLELSEKL